jgi:hypothetical protein
LAAAALVRFGLAALVRFGAFDQWPVDGPDGPCGAIRGKAIPHYDWLQGWLVFACAFLFFFKNVYL